MIAARAFPISPADLIAKAKGILATNNGANEPARQGLYNNHPNVLQHMS